MPNNSCSIGVASGDIFYFEFQFRPHGVHELSEKFQHSLQQQ